MLNKPSMHHRKHVSKARKYKHAGTQAQKHANMPSMQARKQASTSSTQARKHASTYVRKHAKHAST